jgi:hypothetical protein
VAAHGHNGLINAALAIAEERCNMLSQIRELLEADDYDTAIPLMKTYCGLSDDKKSNRTH